MDTRSKYLNGKHAIDKEKSDILMKMCIIEKEMYFVKRIKKLLNECLKCTAYHTKNIEIQSMNLDKVDCPQWERDIIGHAHDIKNTIAKRNFKLLEQLLKDIDKYETKNNIKK